VAHGLGGVTVEGIADRSGVAKSTLYRHWPDAEAIVRDAVLARPGQPPPGSSTGGRGRVAEILLHLADELRGTGGVELAALVDAATRDADVAATFTADNERRLGGLVEAVRGALVEHAGERDADLAAQALAGAVIYRALCLHRPVAPDEVAALVDAILGHRRGGIGEVPEAG
jgi:AcrR family transcriptional regulator